MPWIDNLTGAEARPCASRAGLRLRARVLAAALMAAALCPAPAARAENQMGYQLLTQQEAASLPRNRGSLGLDVEGAQRITDGGMSFELIRVKGVRRASAGARAGFGPGDQIIAVNGRVFASLAAFASFVGSLQPGQTVTFDYIPVNGGPAQAQRVPVTIGAAGGGNAQPAPSADAGMSTGTKIAIGTAAAALFGCYELGCFSHRAQAPAAAPRQPQGNLPQQNGYQRQ